MPERPTPEMAPNSKARRLVEIVERVRQHPSYGPRVHCILQRLQLEWSDVLDAVVRYTLDLASLDNTFYEHPTSRMALYLHSLVDESYHKTRASVAGRFLLIAAKSGVKRAIDVGFGVPSTYVEQVLTATDIVFTLADRDPSASSFATAVLECSSVSEWRSRVTLLTYDMDCELLAQDYDAYLFMDSVEHTVEPTSYLSRTASQAKAGARFILALPIGRCAMEMHFIEWLTTDDAMMWLSQCGLSVEASEIVRPVSGVDLFADDIEGGFLNLIVMCSRRADQH